MFAALAAVVLAAVCNPVSCWRYPDNEANGWGGVCRDGSEQSPIDILVGDKGGTHPASFEPIVFVNYDNLVNYNLTNNGHTAMLIPHKACDAYVTGGGLRKLFKLAQMHFHWGSEHLVNGYRYPLELHLVHYDANYPSLQEALGKNNSLAVVAVLFRQDKSEVPNLELAQVVAGLRTVEGPGRRMLLGARLSPGMLLPTDTERWWRYHGSLTTPDCTQGVVWTVLKDTLPVARDQIKEFQRLLVQQASADHAAEYMLKNFRAPQPLKQRVVLSQDPTQHSKCGAALATPLSSGALMMVALLAAGALLELPLLVRDA